MLNDVAVVIPLYNGEKWIGRTLESVQAQTHSPAEIVVVDDGSSDRSLEVASEFLGVTPLRNPDDGANAARQFGFVNTRAPLVAFLDQDDLWHPRHLESLVAALEKHPEHPAAVAEISWFSSNPSFSAERKDAGLLDPWNSFPRCPIDTPSGAVIRRAVLEEIGGWPTRFVGVADYYTWLRLSVHRPLVMTRRTTAAHRCHEASHSTLLRAEHAPRYLRYKIEAAKDALAHRLAARPDRAATLRRRMDILTATLQMLEAILGTDLSSEAGLSSGANPSDVASAAHRLEDRLDEESDEFVWNMCGQLLWFLEPAVTVAAPPQRRAVLDALFAHWPKTAPRTRRAVQARAKQSWSGWAFVQYLTQRPAYGTAWQLMRDIVHSRMRRKIG